MASRGGRRGRVGVERASRAAGAARSEAGIEEVITGMSKFRFQLNNAVFGPNWPLPAILSPLFLSWNRNFVNFLILRDLYPEMNHG